jgi:TonB family protein
MKRQLFFSLSLLLSMLGLSAHAQSTKISTTAAVSTLGAQTELAVKAMHPDSVYSQVDTAAAFPGGNEALVQWLSTSLQYPESAKLAGISGVVISTFIVEKDGRLSTVEVVRSLDPACDAEVVRLLQQSPPWTPAKRAGQVVRMQMALPVKFALDKPVMRRK